MLPIPPASTSDWPSHDHPSGWLVPGSGGARTGPRGWEGGHGEAVPVPRSQGQPGTSAGVTLPIWALSQDPGPGLAYQHSGGISRSCSRERLGRSELGSELQRQSVLPASQLKAINPFRLGRRRGGGGWRRRSAAGGARPLDSAGSQQQSGPLTRRGNGNRWGDGVGLGLQFPLLLWGHLPLRGFGSQGSPKRCHVASCSQRGRR